jgi:hypothetical protein
MEDTRYPYTYACDLIRSIAGCNKEGTKLSRSDASLIRELFSTVTGIHDKDLAEKLADYYKANEKDIIEYAVTQFTKAQVEE